MKKIILYGVLLFLTYKGVEMYCIYSQKDIVLSCGNLQEAERMKIDSTDAERKLYLRKFWGCVEQKQNFMQKFFLKAPTY